MKHRILTIALCLATFSAIAQNGGRDRISFAATLGTGISISTPSSTPFMWQFLGYYNLTERWALGVGTGLSFHEKTLIPLFGDVKFQIGRERRFTPYVELAAGYSFATAGDGNGGMFLNPSIGVSYPLKNSLKLQLAAGYQMQKLEQLKKYSDGYFSSEFAEQLRHNSISVRLGLSF